MKTFFTLVFLHLSLHARLFAPLAEANQNLKDDCLLIHEPTLTKTQKFCKKYILAIDSTIKTEKRLEGQDEISKQESKAYLNILRKDAQFRKHILHQVEEDILHTKDDNLALKLFNLHSFKATIKSVKNIQNRDISLPQSTQVKIERFLHKYHLPKESFSRTHTQYANHTKPSLAARGRVNYTSISPDYSDPDTIRDYPQNYLNKGFTLECTATGLYVKDNADVFTYKNISGFSCKNNNGATSFLWNVYATGKVLNQFKGLSKKRMNFKAYARVKQVQDKYIIIIDKIEDSKRFYIHYLS